MIRPGMAAAPTVVYNGQVLSESEAILRVLMDREKPGNKLAPAVNSVDYPEYNMWMGFAEGTLAADVVADYRVGMATGGKRPKPAGAQLDGQRAMAFADEFLSRHPYFGGANFSAADIMMWFPTDFADRVKVACLAQLVARTWRQLCWEQVLGVWEKPLTSIGRGHSG